MSGDKNSSMDSTLPVPLPNKSPQEVISSDEDEPIGTQEMSDADETPEERLENIRRFEQWLRNDDPIETGKRYLAEFKLERALELSRLAADDSFSLDGKLIPCPGNVAFHCMVGYYKESMSTCPFCDRMWTEIHNIVTDPLKECKTSLQRLIETLSWRMDEMVGLMIILQSKEVVRSLKRPDKSPVDDVKRAERDSLPAAVDVESARGVVSSTPSASTPCCVPIAQTVTATTMKMLLCCSKKKKVILVVMWCTRHFRKLTPTDKGGRC